MLLFLVRHATAIPRRSWHGDDLDRPLAPKGQRQVLELTARLSERITAIDDAPPPRIVASPALRCVATVTGLAETVGVPVRTDDRLVEAAHLPRRRRPAPEDAEAWLAARALSVVEAEVDAAGGKGAVVVCAHGELLPPLLSRLCPERGRVGRARNQKGGFWVLEYGIDGLTGRDYVAAP